MLESILRKSNLDQTLFLTGLTLFLTFLAIKFYQRWKTVNLINKIPGHPGHFIFGNALQSSRLTRRELFIFLNKICNYGEHISRFWAFRKPVVFIHSPVSAQAILTSNKHITKGSDYDFAIPWLGTGLLTSTGAKWATRRKMLTPTFHFKVLERYFEVFKTQGEKLLCLLSEKKNGPMFDVHRYINNCSMDIILETAFGVSLNIQNYPENNFSKAVHTIFYLYQQWQYKPWLRVNFLFKLLGYQKMRHDAIRILHNFSNGLIKERREKYKKMQHDSKEDETLGIKKHLAFLDLLVEIAENGNNLLNNEDIREEVDTFFFEGHDTTTSGIMYAIFVLACHPEIQAKVHEELDSIFMGSDRPITFADLHQMKYLECCIKESMRLYPTVPFFPRELYEPMEIDGYTIPVGTDLVINTSKIHRDPTQYQECEKFIPERFFPENSVDRHPYAFIPFSAGPRNCIGQKFAMMELKVILSAIFRNFKVESRDNMETLSVLSEGVSRPENGLFIKLTDRK